VLTTPVIVICRGVRFETTRITLLRLGPCFLAMQAEIETQEPIQLDFSAEAFRVLLDALTTAQYDLGKALLHVARSRISVVDLEALLRFVLLGWVLGISLPLPPPPAMETPRGDKLDCRSGFNLCSAYQGDGAGVFHYLVRCARQHADLPCRYGQCTAPDLLLGTEEEYVEPADVPQRGCIPVSIELDAFMMKRRDTWSENFEEWAEASSRVASIYMLQVSREDSAAQCSSADVITLNAGSTAVFDLGLRRTLICEGLVLGMNRTWANKPGMHHDILTVDVTSDLSGDLRTERLACQPLQFEGDLITYFRLTFPIEAQRLGRMFRLKIDPFHPHVGDYIMHDNLSVPLYMLRSMELFGTLLEVPAELCPEEQMLAPFAMEPHVTRLKRRRTNLLE